MKIKRFEWNMLGTNCYVLWDETKEAAIIDASCYYDEEKNALKSFINENNLQVRHLLNTHLHFDHTFGNAFAGREWGLLPEAHEADEFWIEQAPQQSRAFGISLKEAAIKPGKHLHDEDLITFGHTTLEVIHVPGHSPGSIVFYCRDNACAFVGDVLFQGSIGRADLAGGNFEDLIENICSRLFTLPNETIIYPGHGAATTIGIEKMENPFFRYKN